MASTNPPEKLQVFFTLFHLKTSSFASVMSKNLLKYIVKPYSSRDLSLNTCHPPHFEVYLVAYLPLLTKKQKVGDKL